MIGRRAWTGATTLAMLLAPVLTLTACGSPATPPDAAAPPDLEQAAIERGVIRDPANTDLTGLYARGTDKLCIVAAGIGYRIGVASDYGGGIECSGAGRVSRAGDMLRIELGSDGCRFEARFDGERIAFPGRLPEPCARLCNPRASLAGTDVERLSESPAEAASMRDTRGRVLCAAEARPR